MSGTAVEVVLKRISSLTEAEIIPICRGYLNSRKVPPGKLISDFDKKNDLVLHQDVDHISVEENESGNVNYLSPDVTWHVYKLDHNKPEVELCEDENGGEVNMARYYVLPSEDLFGLWESLVFDSDVKQKLLNYSLTMMEFSGKGVSSNIVNCNRVVLLHGPPGTGKTSLCKALAQKVAVRLKSQYKQSVLIEINTHSLFSKWFSESGKLVGKMFDKIVETVQLPKTFVCILVDEVESLTHARNLSLSGNEPSDSVKVVNAVLTRLDQMQHYPNVLILTTSNITTAIDVAFLDRADIKQYIGLPGEAGIAKIYASCLSELIRHEVIEESNRDDFDEAELLSREAFKNVCKESVGLSGRMLRKIPFLAHALHYNRQSSNVDKFLEAMLKSVRYERSQKEMLTQSNL